MIVTRGKCLVKRCNKGDDVRSQCRRNEVLRWLVRKAQPFSQSRPSRVQKPLLERIGSLSELLWYEGCKASLTNVGVSFSTGFNPGRIALLCKCLSCRGLHLTTPTKYEDKFIKKIQSRESLTFLANPSWTQR